ncbi:MAG: preprotein translocase subunit YajC [Deltaproteobacteria bacterium]|nr:preprotein translocase subunit YajC [Deltaproteobacteria bacterium]
MAALAYAQGADPMAGPGPLVQFLPLVLVMIIFYFLLIRPQQQKARDHRQMLDELKRNDRVLTNGGIYGRIIELSERELTLEISPNVRIQVDRGHIETVMNAVKPAAKGASTEKSEGKDK